MDSESNWKLLVNNPKEKTKEIVLDIHGRDVLKSPTINVNESLDISSVTGVPEGYFDTRRARIFMPAKNAMQSATNDTHHWLIGIKFTILSLDLKN